VLTVDFDRLGVRDGARLLDVGCGGGRHTFEAWRRGATVVALDASEAELKEVRAILGAMLDAGEIPHAKPEPSDRAAGTLRRSEAGPERPAAGRQAGSKSGIGGATTGDAVHLPFPDDTFDAVIASEVLEHIWGDEAAITELVRVLRPGGRMAVTVPTRWPERVCWALDHRYHDTPGGHVRIFRQRDLEAKLESAGLWLRGSHHSHALHSPYWWLKCVVGIDRVDAWPVRKYHQFLAWQITEQPGWVNRLDRVLNPVLGKSLVVYTQKVET
jgi:SAM-dependent methyltransferase